MSSKSSKTATATDHSNLWSNGHDLTTWSGASEALREARHVIWETAITFARERGYCDSGLNSFLAGCGLTDRYTDPNSEELPGMPVQDSWLTDEGRAGMAAQKCDEIKAFQRKVKAAVLRRLRAGSVTVADLNTVLPSVGLPVIETVETVRTEVYAAGMSFTFDGKPAEGQSRPEYAEEIRTKLSGINHAALVREALGISERELPDESNYRPDVYTQTQQKFAFAKPATGEANDPTDADEREVARRDRY